MRNYEPRTLRANEQEGIVGKLHGEYRGTFTSGALTTVAAATTTAGFVFTMRNPDTAKKVLLRYVAVDFLCTTAFGAAQAMGYDLILATGYTASCTGGTAIDMGSTLTNSGKTRTNQAASLFTANTCRIGSTGALTAGTHTLHANPLFATQGWVTTTLGSTARVSGTLLDARDDGVGTCRAPISLGQDEGFMIRNTVLMGASGVGTLMVTVEWDEVTL